MTLDSESVAGVSDFIGPLIDTGVYAIVGPNNMRYIGSSRRSLMGRWRLHRQYLRHGDHHSEHLQRAWLKYGPGAFTFQVLATCAPEECIMMEQRFMDAYRSYDPERGYNVCPVAGSPSGKIVTDATRAKLRAVQKLRRPASEETRQLMRENTKALWADPVMREKLRTSIIAGQTAETYKTISKKNLGRKHTPEAIAKIVAASRALTPEKRAEMAAASKASGIYERHSARLKGKKFSAEVCANMSVAKKKTMTPERLAALRIAADKGRQNRWANPAAHKYSEDTKAKRAATRKARFAVYRAQATGTYMEVEFA